jgi:hypothetical protein
VRKKGGGGGKGEREREGEGEFDEEQKLAPDRERREEVHVQERKILRAWRVMEKKRKEVRRR